MEIGGGRGWEEPQDSGQRTTRDSLGSFRAKVAQDLGFVPRGLDLAVCVRWARCTRPNLDPQNAHPPQNHDQAGYETFPEIIGFVFPGSTGLWLGSFFPGLRPGSPTPAMGGVTHEA